MKEDQTESWDTVLSNSTQSLPAVFTSIWKYRYLVVMFVYKEFVTTYKQTVLGPIWIILKPILSTMAFVAAFDRVLDITPAGVDPFIFYMSGIVIWNYFVDGFTRTSNVFLANQYLFSKVYFPRIIAPLAFVVASTFRLLIQMVVLLVVAFFKANSFEYIPWGIEILYILIAVLNVALVSAGVGLVVSALTAKYRDLTILSGFGVQLLMFVSPVIYSLSKVPDNLAWAVYLNPLAGPIELFRSTLIGTPTDLFSIVFSSFLSGFLILIAGLKVFQLTEARAMDYV